jgi:hypothetical protein
VDAPRRNDGNVGLLFICVVLLFTRKQFILSTMLFEIFISALALATGTIRPFEVNGSNTRIFAERNLRPWQRYLSFIQPYSTGFVWPLAKRNRLAQSPPP